MIRTRIAPSPTGKDLHVGNAYTALLNYAFARKNKGRFIVRIEDTDRKRVVEGSEEKIFDSIAWLGLKPDEGPGIGGEYGPYRQSERLKLYRKHAEELIKKDAAYYCFCSPQRLKEMREKQQRDGKPPIYDGRCRHKSKKQKAKSKNGQAYVVRLKMPRDGETVFYDLLRGEIRFKNALINDQVLLKSDGFPTYHLAVVVDDHLMQITHIIRGEEWISSIPKHIQIYKALGWELPIFVHTPLLRNPDKSKLSKRKNPVWVSWYKEQGFLPEALVNYLGLLGFSMPDEREKFTLKEFIDAFYIKRISTSAPIFDIKKLEWLDGEYIRETQNSKLKTQICNRIGKKYNEKIVEKTIPLIKTRIKKLSDYLSMCEFFFEAPTKYEIDIKPLKDWLETVTQLYEHLDEWNHNALYSITNQAVQERKEKRGKLFMSLRVAITGKKIGPPLFESMEILSRRECIKRLKALVT